MLPLLSWKCCMDRDGGCVRRRWGRQGQAVEWRSSWRVGCGKREGVRMSKRKRLGVCEPRRRARWRGGGLVVGRQVGDQWGWEGWGQGDGWVWRGVIGSWGQESHKAAGVEPGGAPGTHHQDLFGVVVQGGDPSSHTDSKGNPGHAEGEESLCWHLCTVVHMTMYDWIKGNTRTKENWKATLFFFSWLGASDVAWAWCLSWLWSTKPPCMYMRYRGCLDCV